LAQEFLKKWWVESDFKVSNLPLSLRLKVSGCHYNSIYNNTSTKQVKQLSNQRQMSKTLLRHTLSPAYGVYISPLIRYARASSNYSDFLKRHLHLRNRLLDQGYTKIRLIRSLKKFIFRYQDLNSIYNNTSTKQVKQLSNQRQMSKTLLRHTLITKIFLTFLLKPYLYTFSLSNFCPYHTYPFDDSGQISTQIYDKRDDFNFMIINFPNMCSKLETQQDKLPYTEG
jgi:hypothetical protein